MAFHSIDCLKAISFAVSNMKNGVSALFHQKHHSIGPIFFEMTSHQFIQFRLKYIGTLTNNSCLYILLRTVCLFFCSSLSFICHLYFIFPKALFCFCIMWSRICKESYKQAICSLFSYIGSVHSRKPTNPIQKQRLNNIHLWAGLSTCLTSNGTQGILSRNNNHYFSNSLCWL